MAIFRRGGSGIEFQATARKLALRKEASFSMRCRDDPRNYWTPLFRGDCEVWRMWTDETPPPPPLRGVGVGRAEKPLQI
jgi:hypothetical protein